MIRTIAPATATMLIGCVLIGAFAAGACSGTDGAAGAAGRPGATGPVGPPGPQGSASVGTGADAGNYLTGPCTVPCHAFTGVLAQWRFSNHSHPQENEVGGGSCGNCHALDGIQQRVAGNVTVPVGATPQNVSKGHVSYLTATNTVGEVSYGGASTIGQIHCSTCHAFDQKTDPHVTGKYAPGQAPIRVPGGAGDTAFIEKSPQGSVTPVGQSVSYRAGNLCIFCHKSRKDAALYVAASNTLSMRWGPHNGPQADIFTGKGGYPLTQAGETYGTSVHSTLASGCVDCHMPPAPENGNVPDHTMKPRIDVCKTCHVTYTGKDFNIDGGRTVVTAGLAELEGLLSDAGLITRTSGPLTPEELSDKQFHLDSPRSATVDAEVAGAVYNYLLVARGKDLGVHNPRYTKQLLWDSIRLIRNKYGGGVPVFLATRPPS